MGRKRRCQVPGCPHPARYELEVSELALLGDDRRIAWFADAQSGFGVVIRLCEDHGQPVVATGIVYRRRADGRRPWTEG